MIKNQNFMGLRTPLGSLQGAYNAPTLPS